MMEEVLDEEWVVVPREEEGERSKGKAESKKGGDPSGQEKGVKTWEELVAQEEMTFHDVADINAVREGHRWRKYV